MDSLSIGTFVVIKSTHPYAIEYHDDTLMRSHEWINDFMVPAECRVFACVRGSIAVILDCRARCCRAEYRVRYGFTDNDNWLGRYPFGKECWIHAAWIKSVLARDAVPDDIAAHLSCWCEPAESVDLLQTRVSSMTL